ncbi:MAG: lipase maturation factor family protein [Candidatus Protochlamydia sp.]|nr:lipase maturation factor family protein [Candidatus Protochlamydia sp.]
MFHPESYTIIVSLFPRLLGLIYFFAFGAFLFQIIGLLGSKGILPVTDFLNFIKTRFPKKYYFYVPSLFWINASDKALLGLAGLGVLISIALMLGFYPFLLLLLIYILYLSIVSVGQDFLSFGWEGFLLEITAYACLLSLTVVPNLMVWICINFLLFRFHLQAGAVKLQSRDLTWSNLTALAFHYQTQPLPNTIAWFIHKLPMGFHKFSTLTMFFIELLLPFALFFTEELRLVVFAGFFGLQFFIWATGNFSYLNHLTAVFCTLLLNNKILSYLFFVPPIEQPSLILIGILFVLGSFCTFMQLLQLKHHFFPDKRIAKWLYRFSNFHLFNPYGIFAVMTTRRYEIVIEGSCDKINWLEYTFYYKPSETIRRPRRISPFQPRLDWQMWFLPFSDFNSEKWLQHFLFHLLKGTDKVLKLIRTNPFPDQPPLYIRCQVYEYFFSDIKEKREEGVWWKRINVGPYSPILSLKI